MKWLESGKDWLLKVALTKAIKRAVQLAVSWLAGLGLSKYGLDLQAETLTLAIYSGLEVLRNWLKHKTGWGWL